MHEERRRREVQAVAEAGEHTWFVELSYDEGDGGHAVGSVYTRRTAGPDGGVPTQALSTNDSLSTMWASPAGSVWVASSSGHVASTAAVRWPGVTTASYTPRAPDAPWSVTRLPAVRSTGIAPNVVTLWGTSDQQVFAGTYGGHIYLWDGERWSQVHEGPGQGGGTIRAFGGGVNDTFAVGEDGVVLHFDGVGWRSVPIASRGETFTGIQAMGDGTVLVSSDGAEGRLHRGTAAGLVEIVRTSIHLIGLVTLDERALFATGDGVAELFGEEVRMIKSTFQTTTAWAGRTRAFFLEPSQPVPSFVEHDPRNAARPWFRRRHG